MGQIYNSGSLGQSTSGGGNNVVINYVASGETLDPLTAPAGVYYLEVGATLGNGPASLITEIYNALVTVRITGVSVNLTAYCHFNETSGYMHYGEWELQNGQYWSNVGPGESSNPAASKGFVITAPPVTSSQAIAPSESEVFSIYLAGKEYGLLTPEEDQTLEQMTQKGLTTLRSAENTNPS